MQTTVSEPTPKSAAEQKMCADEKKPTLLLYCQSSLGIGHTMRSLRIIHELNHVYDVFFLNGGKDIPPEQYPGVHIINLPPIVADPEFVELRPMQDNISLEDIFQQRRDIILSTFERHTPQVLVVELYPFGRGSFGSELVPLLKQARQQGTYTVSSVRDILAKRTDQSRYEQKVIDRMNRYFDALLIHGDETFYPLDESFSRMRDIQSNVHYTGYVVPEIRPEIKYDPADDPAQPKPAHIIASIGGGRFGHELALAVVLAAKYLEHKIPHQITLYTGPFCPREIITMLEQAACEATNLQIKYYTEDLHLELQSASLSISLGGYNTTMDVLATGVPSMMMACRNNGGMDQAPRLKRLAMTGAIDLIETDDLQPETLAAKIVQNLAKVHTTPSINLNGAKNTAALIQKLSNGMSNK